MRGLSLSPGTVVDPLTAASTERRSTDMLRRETERVIERDGGREAVRERVEGRFSERRAERHAAFEEHRAEQSRRERGRPGHAESAPRESQERPGLPRDEARTTEGQPEPTSGFERQPMETSEHGAQQNPEAQGDVLQSPSPVASPETGESLVSLAGAQSGALDPQLRPAGNPDGPRGMSTAPIAPENANPAARTLSADGRAAGKVRAGASPPEPSAEQAARVLQQLRAHLANGKSHVTIDLVPAELGRVSLNVAMRSGKMSAIIRAESAQTLELVERQLPELRSALAQQGIEAERFELHLGFGEAGSRERFSFDAWRPEPPVAAIVDGPVEKTDRGMPARIRDDHGGVDLYA